MTKQTAKYMVIRKYAHTEQMIQLAEKRWATGHFKYGLFDWHLQRIMQAGKFTRNK